METRRTDGALPEDVAGSLQLSLRMLLRWIRRHRKDEGLGSAESTALTRLDQYGPSSSGELARREQISPQSMGATTAVLEARGLISRQPDPNDGRRVILSLTDTGRQVVAEQRAARTRLLAEAIDDEFDAVELQLLADAVPLLERLARRS